MTLGDSAVVPYPDLPPEPTSRRTWAWLTVSSVVLTVTVVTAVWATSNPSAAPRSAYCVAVRAGSLGDELHATKTPCVTDPSFTVVKRGDAAYNCGSGQYAQFRPPFADQTTGRLCLVPNLVVGHCYRFGVPVGMWVLGGCVGPATIKVIKRVDVDDPHACPVDPPVATAPGMAQMTAQPRALPYSSRTYCYADVPDK